MKFKESTLKLYAAPLSDTENTKCLHAIEAIRDALKKIGYTDDNKRIVPLHSDTLSYSLSMRNAAFSQSVQIFIQGSYANNTCVRGESDVDIAVVRDDIHDTAYDSTFGNINTATKAAEAKLLKDTVERALRASFPGCVHRQDKSIKVDGNTYRKQTDAVPCLAMHYFYRSEAKNFTSFKGGIIIYADSGEIIRNFPVQHIENGKAKNVSTKHYYKKMVRIMKKLRYIMSECGYASADDVSSFGLESLLWNIPDTTFMKYRLYGFIFGDIVTYLHEHKYMLPHYKEANGIKPLCPTSDDVKAYSAFIDRLYSFYEYDINEA